MRKIVAICGLLITLSIAASALPAKDISLTGKWTMTTDHAPDMHMVLKQTGNKITGTMDGPHGPMRLSGEVEKENVRLSGQSVGGGEVYIEFTATGTLKSDGTMDGVINSNVGEFAWKAVRE